MKRFSAWGYLLFTIWGLAVGLAASGWQVALLLTVEVLFGLLCSREGLAPLRRWRFWFLIGTAVAMGPWLVRRVGPAQAGATASWPGLTMGLQMAGRAMTIMLAFSLGMSSLSLSDMLGLFDRLHLRGLGFALGVAMNLLGMLQEMARATFETIRLRGGLRRPTMALRLFLVTLISNTLHYGDQVVNAAAMRAFDPAGGRNRTLPLERADLWLVLALAGFSVGIALL